ncbi:hypothetical protein JTB14_025088 [Gonioctena quinquepunctata]|nr:hypothetical protein JTB14_025088 [Gonioctena quinquepunctata]
MSNAKTTPADILCEFFEVLVHNIVFLRKIYPETIFARKKKYGIPVHQCIHPDVNEYVNQCLQAVRFHSRKNQLTRLFVCFYKNEHICERYCFDILKLKNTAEGDSFLVELEQSIRNFILKLHTAQEYLEDLPDDSTFSISLQTTAYSSVEFNQEPSYESFPWIEVKEKEISVSGADIVPLQTLESDCLALQMYIEREDS